MHLLLSCTLGPQDKVLEGGILLCPVTPLWHCWQKLASSESWQLFLSLSHEIRDSRNLVSVLELGYLQLLTLDSHYSLSLVYYTSPTLPSCASHSCNIALLCSLSQFNYPQPYTSNTSVFLINAMFFDSIYKTPLHVNIQHVWILTLIILSLSTWPCSSSLHPWLSYLTSRY